ncbi:NmrA-like family-domain-containing protein [Fusarium oxysporum Fo47]|uniref:NmrA-like family-domain-containing protein n=1 Tax=Fusarium oxysporum Fo47 TaxID=660027 RepID=UPI002869DD4F|nr:NmrA-like family-domain-containing protein [Fusarium oxysporum Fo47]QKD61011.2 NmrA-like family-domain-containing protein [Fusarium oxysporum Fo47]
MCHSLIPCRQCDERQPKCYNCERSRIYVCDGFENNSTASGSTLPLLESPEASERFSIRGICRDIEKPSAKRLKASGVEVVSADLSSESDVRRVLTRASVVFLVTAYSSNSCNKKIEIDQGKNVARVSKVARSVNIFSSLLSVTESTNGQLKHAQEFDSKAEVERFIRQLEKPATFVLPGFYMSLFTPGQYLTRSRQDAQLLQLEEPVSTSSTKFPLIDIDKTLVVLLSRHHLRETRSSESGCVTREVPDDEFLSQRPVSGSNTTERQIEILDMYRFMRGPAYYLNGSLEMNQNIVGGLLVTYEEFVRNGGLT